MTSIKCPNCGATLAIIAVDHLSPAARAVLDWLENARDPSVPPIDFLAAQIDYSHTSAYRAVCDLYAAGYLTRIPKGPRKGKYVFIRH